MEKEPTQESKKVINFLKSDNFALMLATGSVLALAPNTYFVFYKLSVLPPVFREIQALFFCIIISGAILFYTIRKNIPVARNFAIFEFGISSCYYIISLGFSWYLVPAFGIAAIMPMSIYFYASEIEKGYHNNAPVPTKGRPSKNKK